MRESCRRAAAAMLFVAAMTAAPIAVVTVVTPAVSRAACPVGQVASGDVCVPYCPPGSLLDTQTGACVGTPPPPLPPPPPPLPAWYGDITPYFSVCAGLPGPFGFVNIGACI